MQKKILPIAVIVVCLVAQVFSQDNEELLVQEIKRAYTQLKYTEAEIKARTALTAYQNFSSDQLSEIHKILGLVYYSQNKISESRQQFISALSINPQLKLDPVLVSPKILTFFEKVKISLESKQQENFSNPQEVRYVVLNDPRPNAIVRSMVLPGWGQTYKSEKRKGSFLMAAWGVTFAGTLTSHFARKSAEDKYLAEVNPDLVKSRYDDFNKWHVMRNNFALAAAGVWLFSYLDTIFKKSDHREPLMSGSKQSLYVAPDFSPDQTSVQIHFNF